MISTLLEILASIILVGVIAIITLCLLIVLGVIIVTIFKKLKEEEK